MFDEDYTSRFGFHGTRYIGKAVVLERPGLVWV
jgi:hypothetical protein